MNFGFEGDRFYIDIPPAERKTNIRQETELLAEELAYSNNKLLLSLSSGLDSQAVLHSFYRKGIPFEAVFMYLPGFNDFEYNNLKILEKKYSFKCHIVDLDVSKLKEQIENEADQFDVNPLVVMHKIFLSQLPEDRDFIQVCYGPIVAVNDAGEKKYIQSYYDMEISKIRVFNSLNRSGRNILFGSTSNMLLSVMNDDIFKAAISACQYFDGNGLKKDKCFLSTVDRYDYYIKPLLYGKYWAEELIYFPKFAGIEKIDFLNFRTKFGKLNRFISIPYKEIVNHLAEGTEVKRFYQFV